MNREEIKSRVRTYVSRFFRNHDLQDDEDIFALGFINSLAALQLVQFLEKEFGVAIGDEDLELDNFRTLNSMDQLLERKLASDVAA